MGKTALARARQFTPAGGRLIPWRCEHAAVADGRLSEDLVHWTVTITLDNGGVPDRFACLHDAKGIYTAAIRDAADEVLEGPAPKVFTAIDRVCQGTMINPGPRGAPGTAPWPRGVDTRPRWEWYRPEAAEASVILRAGGPQADHYRRGGLLVRPATRAYR